MSRFRENTPDTPSSAPPRTRALAAAWAVVLATLAALHLTNVTTQLGGNLGGDNTVYYLLSKAIATGQGYVDLYLPGHPSQVKFPPLFPLLLAPFNLLFKNPLPTMHVMVALFNVGACAALGLMAGRRLGAAWMGPVMALVVGTLPKVYLQSAHLLSEPVYMAFSYLVLLVLPEERDARISACNMTVLALVMLAAFFTRTAGLTLSAAMAAALILHRADFAAGGKKLPAGWAVACLFVVAAGAWSLSGFIRGGHGMEYLSELVRGDPSQGLGPSGQRDFVAHALHNAALYLPYLGSVAFTPVMYIPLSRPVYLVASWLLAAAVACGAMLELRRGRYTAVLFAMLSLLIAVFWPFREERFVLPIVPLAVFFLFYALHELARALGEKMAGSAMALLAAVVLAANAWVTGHYASWRFEDLTAPPAPVTVQGFGDWTTPVINWAGYDVRALGLDQHQVDEFTDYVIINRVAARMVPPGAVIMSRKPMITYYYSGRESVPLLYDPLPEKQWQYIEQKQVDYIVTGIAEDELRAVMERWPDRFRTVASISPDKARLIRVVRTDTP